MKAGPFELKRWARWLGTFVGFPLAGVAARVVAGNIDAVGAPPSAGWPAGRARAPCRPASAASSAGDALRWIAATAAGLAVGLTVGRGAVGYRTDTASLVVMGAISGAGVGARPGAVGPDARRSTGSCGPWPPRCCGPAAG